MIRRFTSARWFPHQRALAISLAIRRDTGHAHPHRDVVRASDAGLRAAMG